MERLSRRQLLATAATGVGAAAGCLGPLSGSGGSAGAALTLQSVDVGPSPGGEVQVRDPDRVSLIDFFATWCAPCEPQMAELRSVQESVDDLHLVSITQETDREAIRDFWRRLDGTWPVAIDADLRASEAYGITRIPTMVVVAPDGTETWRHSGLSAAETIIREVRDAQP